MKEKDIQTLFTRYIKENRPKETAVYELKIVKGKSLSFSSVKPHQVYHLTACASDTGDFWKIPDTAAINGFTEKKHYDCQFIRNASAYVCLCWYIPRKRKTMYMIEIGDWIGMVGMSDRKSVTEDMAKLVASEIIEL